MPSEKMMIDMLSFLSVNPKGLGFNEIGRALAEKGYKPLYAGKQGKGKSSKALLHPNTARRLLKGALESGLIATEYPLGKSPKGKRNRYRLTKLGRNYLAKNEAIRFIEDANPKEMKMSSKLFEEPFLKFERNLNHNALEYALLDPNNPLELGPEDKFFIENNIAAFSQQLRFGAKITLWVPGSSPSLRLTSDQIMQLSALMVAYAGNRAFSIVMSYKPEDADIQTNPLLCVANGQLNFLNFHKWLSEFKNDNIDEDRLYAILEVGILGAEKNRHSGAEFKKEEIAMYKTLWKEYAAKRDSADNLMSKVRKKYFNSPKDPMAESTK